MNSKCEYFIKKNTDYIFLNPSSFNLLRRNSFFNSSSLKNKILFFDGFFLVLLLKIFFRISRIKRVSFDDTSLAPLVFQFCKENSLSVGLIGSEPGIAVKASELIQIKYPGIEIKFIQDGFYKENDEQSIIQKSIQCDVIICSMGTPRQETFLTLLRKHDWKGTGYTCGGYLDQLVSSNGSDYYPKYIDKFNLRWLYRIWKEPRRLLLRYLIDYPKGITLFMYDFITCKFNKNNLG